MMMIMMLMKMTRAGALIKVIQEMSAICIRDHEFLTENSVIIAQRWIITFYFWFICYF